MDPNCLNQCTIYRCAHKVNRLVCDKKRRQQYMAAGVCLHKSGDHYMILSRRQYLVPSRNSIYGPTQCTYRYHTWCADRQSCFSAIFHQTMYTYNRYRVQDEIMQFDYPPERKKTIEIIRVHDNGYGLMKCALDATASHT